MPASDAPGIPRCTATALALVAAFLATGCGSLDHPGSAAPQPVPFTVLSSGGGAGLDLPAQTRVLSSVAAVRRALPLAVAAEGLGEVDFHRHRVVLVSFGTRPSGGYRLRVESVQQADDRVVVHVTEEQPGARCMAAAVLTNPWVLLRIPVADTPVRVARRTRTVPCD